MSNKRIYSINYWKLGHT